MRIWSILTGWLGVAAVTAGQAQPATEVTLQWASRVIGVSSEKRGEQYGQQYRASQALGHPSKLPQLGASPTAWAPQLPDNPTDDWIQVGFPAPMTARQVVVAENVNPGAVSRIVVTDDKGTDHTVFTNPTPQPRAEPILRVPLPGTGLTVVQVKVFLNGAAIKGINQIDAIGLTTHTNPVVADIRLAKGTPSQIVKENLGKTVNSPGQEVAPVITPDGRTLYFTRNYNKANIGDPDRQDVWYSTLSTGTNGTPAGWSEAVNIGPPINNASDNAISGISADGKTVYLLNLYQPNGATTYGFSKSIRTRIGWSFPVGLTIKNNYNLPERESDNSVLTELTVSPDERAMILSVRRRDTQGDRDLYVTLLLPDRTWSEPVHLGNVINTADTESAPFLASDNKTLYFTSKGHPGYGNGDIFVSRRLDESWGNWSEPENLGPAINTAEWDGYFTIPAAGDYAYLSSRAGSMGEDDIFRLKLFPTIRPDPVAIVSGQVLDAQTKKPIASEVVSDLFGEKHSITKVAYDPETGEFKLILPTQHRYTLRATQKGYFPTTEVLDLSKDKRFRDIRRNLYLLKIEPGQIITMREVLFEQSQYALSPGADAELDQVAEMLTTYPTMELLIEGHTDNQGDWEPNMKLANDRVRVVKEYLLGKGIADNRLQTKAWGPSKPVASNETEEKRKLNRRVEFTILKL
ncbi:hypothetical protein GCM10027578_27960 [Spirosoma luteolum]